MARSLAIRPAAAEAIASIASTAKAVLTASHRSESHAARPRVLSFDLALIGRVDSIQEPLFKNHCAEIRTLRYVKVRDSAPPIASPQILHDFSAT
jgi:hypothetical protein